MCGTYVLKDCFNSTPKCSTENMFMLRVQTCRKKSVVVTDVVVLVLPPDVLPPYIIWGAHKKLLKYNGSVKWFIILSNTIYEST